MLASLAFVAIARSGWLSVVPGWLLAVACLAILLVVPGWSIRRLLSASDDSIRGLAEAGAYGLGWWAFLGLAFFFARLTLDIFAWLALVATACVTFVPARTSTPSAPVTDRWSPAALAAVAVVFAAISAQSARFHPVYFDTYFHLAGARQVLEGGPYTATDPFLGGAAPSLVPYSANTWYLLLALSSWSAHVPIEISYVAASALVAVGSVLIVYVLGRVMLGDRARAVLTATIYVMYMTIAYTWIIVPVLPVMYMAFGAYPGELLRFLPYTLLLVLMIEVAAGAFIRGPAIGAALITAALVTIHGQYLLYVAVSGYALFVAALFMRDRVSRLRRYALAAIPMGIVGMGFVLLRAGLGVQNAAHWYTLPYDENPYVVQHDYLVLRPNLFTLNPTAFIAPAGVIYGIAIAGAVAILIGGWAGIRRAHVAYALVLLLVPFTIMYNPIVIPLLVRIFTWILPRRLDFFPNLLVFVALAGAFITAVLTALFRRYLPRVESRAATWAVIVGAAVVMLASPTVRDPLVTALGPRADAIDITAERHDDLIAYFDTQPGPVVVCADLSTSYLIGAFTSQRVIAVDSTRMGVSDEESAQRLADNQAMLSGTLTAQAFRALAGRYGVEYVVLPHASPAAAALLAFGIFDIVHTSPGEDVLRLSAPRE